MRPATPEGVDRGAPRLRAVHPLSSKIIVPFLAAIYACILFEDALRKTLGAPGAVLVVKDIVILILYAIYLPRVSRRDAAYWAPLWIIGGALFVWLALEATLPAAGLGTFLLALKAYILYIPLIGVGRVAFADEQTRNAVLRGLTLAGAFVGAAALASALFKSTAPRLLQPIVDEVATHSYTHGELFLAPSIFATGEKAADQLLLATLAAATLALQASSRRSQPFAVAALALTLVGLYATARRTPLILALIGLVLLFAGVKRAGLNNRALPRARTVGGLMVVCLVSVFAVSILGIRGFVGYIADVNNAVLVVRHFVALPPDSLRVEGNGSGSATPGAEQLGLSPPAYFGESEGLVAKVWFELGPIGFVLYFALLATALRAILRAQWLTRPPCYGTAERAAAFFVVSVFILGLKAHQTFGNSQVQIAFWLAAGFASRYSSLSPGPRSYLRSRN